MSGKFFMAFIFVIMLATQINFCQAMPYSEMYLGGLTVGSTVDEMKKIYGLPNSTQETVKNIEVGYYGKDVRIAYSNRYTNRIYSVTVSANNGWKTPSGLAVSDNISKALNLYDKPDDTKSNDFKTAYCYFHHNYDDSQKKEVIDSGFLIIFDKDSEEILEMKICGDTPLGKFAEFYKDMMIQMIE